MREFAFTVRFDRGADDLMDLFVEEPTMRAESKACFANERSMWRVDEIRGPSAALERLDEVYLDETTCNECLDVERCHSTRAYQVLDRGTEHRIIYSRREDIDRCHSIPGLAVEEVGDGVILEASRRGAEYVWRVLVPDTATVGRLYDRVDAELREGLSLDLAHVTDPEGASFTDPDALLTTDERAVLTTAVENGYYGVPRGTTVTELADVLDTPRSTVQHRLQRAEAKIVEQFVDFDR